MYLQTYLSVPLHSVCQTFLPAPLSIFPIPPLSPVSPVEPTEVKAQNLSPNKVQLSWALLYTHNDQQPSSITILLTNLTDSSPIETTLPGSPTNHVLDVVPGTRYRAVLIANNEDGEMSTLPIYFRATPAREP